MKSVEGFGNEITCSVVAISKGEGVGKESGDVAGRGLSDTGDDSAGPGDGGCGSGERGREVMGKIGGRGRIVLEIIKPLEASATFGGRIGVPTDFVAMVGTVTKMPGSASVKAGFTDSEGGGAGFIAGAGVFGKRGERSRRRAGSRGVRLVGGRRSVVGRASGVLGGTRVGGGGGCLDGGKHGDNILFGGSRFPVDREIFIVGKLNSLEDGGVH